MWWRLKGLWQYLRGDVKWERLTRVGFQRVGGTGQGAGGRN
jgi:hypothetical protein